MFKMPVYHAPDFTREPLASAPNARIARVVRDGVAPEGFHSTSMFPEYVKVDGVWRLAKQSRMDASMVVARDDAGAPFIRVVENRNLKQGDQVVLGRTERGEEGIYLHENGFAVPRDDIEGDDWGAPGDGGELAGEDAFVFRQGRSRETSFARDYDRLYELLRYEREHGKIVWVMGPAFAFNADARYAMQAMVENGYVDGIMAGNALATHDLEGSMFHTALGQDIYTQKPYRNGHYHHLDVINRVRRSGSIEQFVCDYGIRTGIVSACVRNNVPMVLAGSIRDDGPLPEVVGNVYDAQGAMREMVSGATTLICLATTLHTIAAGNMTPSYTVTEDGTVRPVFLYAVDISEFAVNKLLDRGSLAATTIVANVQDFITIVARQLGVI